MLVNLKVKMKLMTINNLIPYLIFFFNEGYRGIQRVELSLYNLPSFYSYISPILRE